MEFKAFGRTFYIGSNNIKNQASGAEWVRFLQGRGYDVNADTAMKVAVVIRCADVVAKTMASLGCHIFKRETVGNSRFESHPLYKLLRYQPNPHTTAYEFWHMYVFSLMLSKGAYAKKVRNGSGKIIQLWNLPSANTTLKFNEQTNERYLELYNPNGATEKIYDFMYTPGIRFSKDEEPEDFIRIASEVLGLTINLNEYANRFFKNGSNVGGFITYPGKINEPAFQKFKEDWGKAYAGVMNSHKWAILEGGFDVKPMDADPKNSQALESREFQITEICRLMGVTPHKAFSLKGVNYNSIEQLNIEFWQETIDPMDERLCQTIFKDLFTEKEQVFLYAKFNTNKLLKGDTAARTSYYNTMRQNGAMSANDIRALEDMNPIPEEKGGDAYLVNGNMISLANAENNLPKSMQGGKQ